MVSFGVERNHGLHRLPKRSGAVPFVAAIGAAAAGAAAGYYHRPKKGVGRPTAVDCSWVHHHHCHPRVDGSGFSVGVRKTALSLLAVANGGGLGVADAGSMEEKRRGALGVCRGGVSLE